MGCVTFVYIYLPNESGRGPNLMMHEYEKEEGRLQDQLFMMIIQIYILSFI